MLVVGNGTEENVLLLAGIERAHTLATVLTDDTINVFIPLIARELNEQIEIIARGETLSTKRKLIRSGANCVVLPAA